MRHTTKAPDPITAPAITPPLTPELTSGETDDEGDALAVALGTNEDDCGLEVALGTRGVDGLSTGDAIAVLVCLLDISGVAELERNTLDGDNGELADGATELVRVPGVLAVAEDDQETLGDRLKVVEVEGDTVELTERLAVLGPEGELLGEGDTLGLVEGLAALAVIEPDGTEGDDDVLGLAEGVATLGVTDPEGELLGVTDPEGELLGVTEDDGDILGLVEGVAPLGVTDPEGELVGLVEGVGAEAERLGVPLGLESVLEQLGVAVIDAETVDDGEWVGVQLVDAVGATSVSK